MSVNINRREFLSGFAAFAAAFASYDVFAKATGLPEEIPVYYNAYLAEIVARVNRHRMEDGCGVGFWFLTDLHISANHRKSGLLLTHLVSETGLRRVICGGDLPTAFGTAQDLDAMVRLHWPHLWRDPLQQAGASVCLAKGNHDCHITRPDKRQEHLGAQYSAEEVAALVRECNGNAAATTDAGNPAAAYCFFDVAEEKVRYVIADTSDAPCERTEKVGVVGGHVQMSERQLKWLAGTALGTVPAGYAVVVVHHVPVARVVATTTPPPSLRVFKSLLEVYQNRQAIEIGGTRFDFAKRRGGDIALDLTGHHHSDRQAFENGILHLSESCDALYRDYLRRTPFSGALPEKKGKTVYEQTFDCIQLNLAKGLVYVTRVGGGQDRVYHLRPTEVKSGDTVALAASAVAAADWKAFDCDACKINARAQTPEAYWTFLNVHGKVGTDGRFAAGTPGPSLAVALDAQLRKEFFPIVVTGGAASQAATWESNRVLERDVVALERRRDELRKRVGQMKTRMEELDHTSDLLLK